MSMASTDAIRIVREYRLNSLFDPGQNWPRDIFRERCWQQVGCEYLIEQLRANPFAEPQNVVEEYIMKMDKFANEHDRYRRMFKAMKEVGETVARLLE